MQSSTRRLVAAATLAMTGNAAQAQEWQFGVTPYLWLPNIEANGTTDPPPDGGTPSFEVGPVDYLDNLDFVLMLSGEARRERLSLRADVIYLDFSNQRSAVKNVTGPGGAIEIPVNAGTTSSFTGLLAQTTIGYWLVDQPKHQVELFGGLRYLDLSFDLHWEFDGPLDLLPQSGRIEQNTAPLDAIVGTNARFAFGNGQWFVPLHADIGAGGSSLTWQLYGGVGYSFSWGDLLAIYRHLEYENGSDEVLDGLAPDGLALSGLALSGPAIGASFRF